MSRGKLDGAEELYREVLAAGAGRGETDNIEMLITENNFAYLLQLQGHFEEAEERYRRALAGLRESLGDRHPKVLDTMNNLGTLLHAMGQLEDSAALLRQTLDLRRDVLGAEHPWTLHSINNLASVLQTQGRLDEAEPLYREAAEGNRRLFGDNHPETLTSMNNLAFLLDDRGENSEAERLYREVAARRIEVLGITHQDSLSSMHNLASLLLEENRLQEAERWSRQATETARHSLQEGHYLTAIFEGRLGVILTRLGHFEEAEETLLLSLEGMVGSLGADHPRTKQTRDSLAELYETWGRPESTRPSLSGEDMINDPACRNPAHQQKPLRDSRLPSKPQLRRFPLPGNGSFRNLEGGSGFFHRHPPEISELHHPRLSGIEHCQLLQSVFDLEQSQIRFRPQFRGLVNLDFSLNARPLAAACRRAWSTRILRIAREARAKKWARSFQCASVWTTIRR